jgi:chromosome segregation ATPase
VKTAEERLRELAHNPAGLAEYAAQLQQQLAEKDQALAQAQQELAQKAQQLAEAQAIIAELKRELFGAKADKLNAEQEEHLRQLLGDRQEQGQRSPPLTHLLQ